jgi:ribonuclease HI
MRGVSIYCDGAAHERAGLPGGWAFAVIRGEEKVLSRTGHAAATTNNVMEVTAALRGLRAVIERRWHRGPVELVSDSRIALDIANGSWLPKRPVERDFELRAACLRAKATTRWVRGHSGEKWNEHVDALAAAARDRAR